MKRVHYWICTPHCFIFLCLTLLHFLLRCRKLSYYCLMLLHLHRAAEPALDFCLPFNCEVKWVSLNHLTCLSTFGTVQKSVSNQLQKLKFAFMLAADDVMWIASLMQGLSTCSEFMTSHTCLRRGVCLDYFSYVSCFVFNPEYGPSMRVEQYCFFWEQPTQTTTMATEQ